LSATKTNQAGKKSRTGEREAANPDCQARRNKPQSPCSIIEFVVDSQQAPPHRGNHCASAIFSAIGKRSSPKRSLAISVERYF
jgi:hypothetical protein